MSVDITTDVFKQARSLSEADEARQLGAALAAEQKQGALALTDKLITDAKALVEIIVSDAKHIGDLGQIAALNRYVYRYLNELRAEVESWASKTL